MHRIIAAAWFLALSLAPLLAQEKPPAPAPTTDSAAIDKLIEQLGDRNFRAREAAAKALDERGESTLPALRRALNTSTSPEVRSRLQTIVTAMERKCALQPKRVTLTCKNMPVNDVVSALSKQTGYSIQHNGNRGVNLTFDLQNVTFWEALDRICLDTGLTPQQNDGAVLQLYQQELLWPHTCYQGPFKVMANSFQYNKSISLGGLQRNPLHNQSRSETLNFSFSILSEPKLPIMQIGQAKLIEALDENGVSMKMPNANMHESQYYNGGGYRTHNQSGFINLLWPNKEVRTVKRIKASLPVTVLAFQKPEIEVAEITKVKNKKFTGNGTEIQIDDVKELNNKTSYHIKMGVRNLSPNANQDYTWSQSVYQRIELYDAKGNKYFSQGQNWESGSPANVQATFMFGTNGDASIGPPVRLVFNHWGMLQHQVDFEFRDLPLP